MKCFLFCRSSISGEGKVPTNESVELVDAKSNEPVALHKVLTIKHDDHAHKVHTIQILPATSAKLLTDSLSNPTKEVERVQQSSKCACDAYLIAERQSNKGRVNIPNVYANQLELNNCDAEDQKRCRDFCVLQVSFIFSYFFFRS